MTTAIDLPNGYFTVGPGKLVNAVTWLELGRASAPPSAEPLRLVDAVGEAGDALFADVGAPWLWCRSGDRADPPPACYAALDDAGRRIGFVELSGAEAGSIEIVYFGLIADVTGKGLGRRMMAAALELAWRTVDRVWLHTCNFDHPAALRFYRACGFVPYATGFEVTDDPRVDGRLPRDAAPHVPLAPGAVDPGPAAP